MENLPLALRLIRFDFSRATDNPPLNPRVMSPRVVTGRNLVRLQDDFARRQGMVSVPANAGAAARPAANKRLGPTARATGRFTAAAAATTEIKVVAAGCRAPDGQRVAAVTPDT